VYTVNKKGVRKMDNKNQFAKNLQYYMDANNKSRSEVADAIGVSYYTYTSWVTGRKYPRMDKVEKLARYFGIKKSDLIEKKTEADIKEIEQNDTSVLLTIRLRTDDEFRSVVEGLDKLDAVQLASVKQIVETLLRK
jgi:transcriptional regulator with XRE-family HTH domain